LGGGITILNILSLLGKERMERFLFHIKPDLVDKAKNVKVIEVRCPECKNEKNKLFGWQYEVDGEQKEFFADQKCTSCQTEMLSKQITEEFQKKRIETLISNWWYLSDNEKAGFKNYDSYNECTTKAKELSISYVQLFSRKMLKEKNLLLMGNPGTGKTHLAKAIARTLSARGFKVGYIPAVELFNKVRLTYNDGTTDRVFQEMKKLDLLVIDDVGVETTKIDDVSWTVRTWTEIIECRMGLPNVWTTNLDDNNLPKIIGERAFSRMYENTRFIDLFTEDYRKKKGVLL
jgi:DNA replication protein DnaC